MSETIKANNFMKFIRVLMRGSAVWLIIIFAESLHGTLRELFLTPLIGDTRARQISFFTALAIIFTITIILIRWIGASNKKQLFAVGITWAALTFIFEAVIVRSALDISWGRLLADYDIFQGGVMAIGLMILALAPFFAAWMRGKPAERVDPAH
ncbi:hypothetical protein BH24ACI3_BH24ACI3_08040 [soil metagenome]